MTVLWVLDVEGYDARGGNARVFSTKEAAKAATNVKEWRASNYRAGEECEHLGNGSTADAYVVYPVVVDEGELPEPLASEQARLDAEYQRQQAERNAAWRAAHPLVKTESGGVRRLP